MYVCSSVHNPPWSRVLRILPLFRNAFSRQRTFLWFCCAIVATMLRTDLLGVTSLARSLGGKSKIYGCLLGFFASGAVKLDRVSRIWGGILSSHKMAYKVNGRVLLVVDGIKAPKSGCRMPAVKRLHQQSSSNTKPTYITGHSCQSIAILFGSLAGVFAVPVFHTHPGGPAFFTQGQKITDSEDPKLAEECAWRSPVLPGGRCLLRQRCFRAVADGHERPSGNPRERKRRGLSSRPKKRQAAKREAQALRQKGEPQSIVQG